MATGKSRSRRAQWIILILVLLAGAVVSLGRNASQRGAMSPREGGALAEARTWGYQLQKLRPRQIPADIDMLVVDYSRDGTEATELNAQTIETLRKRPDGRRRIVLCYLSIGEAEDYRYYWWKHWSKMPPPWLGGENKEWKGNYPVRYWFPDWQRIIFEPSPTWLSRIAEIYLPWRKPYLERIIEAGFDGVYLDRVDVFQEWEKSRKGARADMVRFVTALSAHAKARKPGFLIVPQNGEELLMSWPYRKAIDGIAKEDLLYGVGGDETVNSGEDVARSTALLNRAKGDGLPVFVVEYLSDRQKQIAAQRQIGRLGFIPLFAERELSSPPEIVLALPPEPSRAPVAVPQAPAQAPPSAAEPQRAPLAPPVQSRKKG